MSGHTVFFIHTQDKERKVKRFIVTANNSDQARKRVKQSVIVNSEEDIVVYLRPPLIWDHKEAHVLFA